MKRREFIGLVDGVATWPFAGRAQQSERVRRVAWVAATSPLSELVGANPAHPLARGFLQAMRELGYVEGRNLVVEWRSAEGKFDDLPEIIRQLVANNVDVIVSARGTEPEYERARFDGASWGLSRPRLNVRQSTHKTLAQDRIGNSTRMDERRKADPQCGHLK